MVGSSQKLSLEKLWKEKIVNGTTQREKVRITYEAPLHGRGPHGGAIDRKSRNFSMGTKTGLKGRLMGATLKTKGKCGRGRAVGKPPNQQTTKNDQTRAL